MGKEVRLGVTRDINGQNLSHSGRWAGQTSPPRRTPAGTSTLALCCLSPTHCPPGIPARPKALGIPHGHPELPSSPDSLAADRGGPAPPAFTPLLRHTGRSCQSFEQRPWEKSTAHRPRSTLHLLLPTSLRPSPHKAVHRRAPCTSCSLLPAHTA